DCTAADSLLDRLLAAEILHGDKGYDSDAVRRKIESKGAAPNIPPKINRRWKNCFSPWLYRHRNAIERMFGRLTDFRRIATRYVLRPDGRAEHNTLVPRITSNSVSASSRAILSLRAGTSRRWVNVAVDLEGLADQLGSAYRPAFRRTLPVGST